MAEIEIVKKKPVWPWILLALIILAILYFVFFTGDADVADTKDDTVEMTTDDVIDTTDDEEIGDDKAMMLSETANTRIADYNAYIDKDPDMGIDHEYASSSLNKLIDATEAVANTLDVDIKADLETARNNAAAITSDPYELDHADKIKNAGNIIVRALKTLQTQKFPNLGQSSTDLQNALNAIARAHKR